MTVVGKITMHQLAEDCRGYLEIEDTALLEKALWLQCIAGQGIGDRLRVTAQRFFEAYLECNDRFCDAYGMALLDLHPAPFALLIDAALSASVISL